MTVSELVQRLTQIGQTFPNAPVHTQGWDDMGNLQDIVLRGDVRLERDSVGNPVIVLR
jgi:hypothetical protein